MMNNPIGPMTDLDEHFAHQITDTLAVAGTSDPSWTEKVCAMAAARDGSIQLGFGLGKYVNRDVMDGYAGISRGVEQATVRSSRRLDPEPLRTAVGPIHYDIVEPRKRIRFRLEANDVQPIAFDWLFEASVPPCFEDRTHMRTGYRVSAELVRYHQVGVCSGWLEIDGERIDLDPRGWVSTRDHSWGVRYGVGVPASDVRSSTALAGGSYHFAWSPSYLERADGSSYAIFLTFGHARGTGFDHREAQGRIEHPDGRVERIVDVVPELSYHPANRRLRGGRVHCTLADGTQRTLQVEVVSDTGFHLGTGLYFGFDGHYHGEWRGDLHVDGERIADCADPTAARRVHQIRDTVVRVSDPAGGGRGWGNWQPMVTGSLPELGLDERSSFV